MSGPASLELAARAAYPLVVNRQIFPDRGTSNNKQVDRRQPGTVIERMRSSDWGIHQLGQALTDHAAGQPIRAVSSTGALIPLEEGQGVQVVTDNWLRTMFPPPGRPVAPLAPDTVHERYLEALSKLGEAMDEIDRSVQRLLAVEGLDGRSLTETEGVSPQDADAWTADLLRLLQLIPVWCNTHVSRSGPESMPVIAESDGDETSGAAVPGEDAVDEDQEG